MVSYQKWLISFSTKKKTTKDQINLLHWNKVIFVVSTSWKFRKNSTLNFAKVSTNVRQKGWSSSRSFQLVSFKWLKIEKLVMLKRWKVFKSGLVGSMNWADRVSFSYLLHTDGLILRGISRNFPLESDMCKNTKYLRQPGQFILVTFQKTHQVLFVSFNLIAWEVWDTSLYPRMLSKRLAPKVFVWVSNWDWN